VRRTEIEGTNLHIVIIDFIAEEEVRIINLYSSFNPEISRHLFNQLDIRKKFFQ
jgi:hypothetical protein